MSDRNGDGDGRSEGPVSDDLHQSPPDSPPAHVTSASEFQTVDLPALFEREVTRLEHQLFTGSLDTKAAALEDVISRMAAPDALDAPVLLGRAYCLLARVRIAAGQHAAAIAAAEAGLLAFSPLRLTVCAAHAGVHSELYRALGTAQLKLGTVSDALPNLESAVRIARDALNLQSDEHAGAELDTAACATLSALIRGLVTLGVALFAIREVDMAIQVYSRALATADANPIAYARFPDDMMLVTWNLTDALHERATNRRAAGLHDLAADDIATARRFLDPANWKIAEHDIGEGDDSVFMRRLSTDSREGYFASMGRHLLITGQPAQAREMFERQHAEIARKAFVDDWGIGDAEAGIAQAALALALPADALEHCRRALDALGRHEESNTRATVLRVAATAYRALDQCAAAYEALEEYHRIRTGLEAAATQQYAAHMNAQIGLERARADAESHRRIAETLETVGRVGQEITANLDADAIFTILHRSVVSLLHAPTFAVWLLDASGEISLAYGVDRNRIVCDSSIAIDHARSMAARAVRDRREISGPSTSIDGLPGSGSAAPSAQTAVFSPLVVGERAIGVVSIQSERATGYTEDERSIFRTLCTYGAIAIDNAAAYRKLGKTVEALQSTQAELAIRTAEYERLSLTDPLTGVANRRALGERATVEIAEVKRKNGRLSVVMFDIDHFKDVNDTYGHGVGDAVLQNVARVAKLWLRPADLIARIGGEEFALLLPGAGRREAVDIAERIRASIAETMIDAGSGTVSVTTSFGVTEFDVASDDLEDALLSADTALYAAKDAGRNRVHVAP